MVLQQNEVERVASELRKLGAPDDEVVAVALIGAEADAMSGAVVPDARGEQVAIAAMHLERTIEVGCKSCQYLIASCRSELD